MKNICCTLLGLLGFATFNLAYSQVINTNGQVIDLTALRLAASQAHHGRTNHIPFVPSNATNGWRAPVARPALASEVQQIKATASGASAQFGLQKVDFGSDIAAKHPIKLVSPDGQKLWCRPTALGYFDTQSGQSVILSWVKPSLGEIQSTNQVIYRDAFTDLRADVQYEYSGNCLEQNIILRERPAAPETYGLNPETTHLEIWTAWSNARHLRTQHSRVTLRHAGNGAADRTADDTTLDFGAMKIARGKAFKLINDPQPVAVAKEWHSSTNGGYLLEIVDYKAIEAKLNTLPTFGALTPRPKTIPEFMDRKTLLAALDNVKAGPESKASLRLAQAKPEDTSGVVLDFVAVAAMPLPADACAWWKAESNAQDLLGSNHGTLMNGATSYAAGQVGNGFGVNGVNSYVKIPHSASLNPGPQFSLEFWVKPDLNNPMNSYQGLVTSDFYGVEISNGYSGTMGLNFYTSPDNGVTWNMISTANGGGAPITAGTWHHVAGTYDGAKMRLYVDGQPWGNPFACSGTISPMPATGFLAIGSEAGRVTCGCSRYFNGVIDEVTLYQRALSPSEIAGIYQANGGGKSNPDCFANWSSPAAWWSGDGNAKDLVGNHDGTLKDGTGYGSGRVGQAFDFDGSSYVEVPDSEAWNFGDNDFSVDFWVNFRSLDDGDLYYPEAIFLAHDDGGGDLNKWIFGLNGRLLTLLVDDPIVGVQFLGQVPFEPDMYTWYHIALVHAGNALKFYVNGVCLGSDTTSTEFQPATAPLTIGQAEGIGYFTGSMDEVAVYNHALTGAEIAAVYSAGAAGRCKDDLDRDQMPDWWEMKYFGTTTRDGSQYYDGDEVSDLAEFQNGSDPNTIQFNATFPKPRVNNRNLAGLVSVTAGHPDKLATVILERDFSNGERDFSTAIWEPYPVDNHVSVTLPSQDGHYEIWVGVKGRADDSEITWQSTCVILDTTLPVLTLDTTGRGAPPSTVTGSKILLTGSSPEALSKVRYHVNSLPDQSGSVIDVGFNAVTKDFGASTFECRDIQLQPGNNVITIQAWDLVGNLNSITKTITYNLPAVAPTLNVTWPPNNAEISGSEFVICGEISDASATVVITADGESPIPAQVESGIPARFFAKGIALHPGTKIYTVKATDVASHVNESQLSVTKSSVEFGMSFTPGASFDISGFSTVPVTSVNINGQPAILDDEQDWHVVGMTPNGVGGIPVMVSATLATGGNVIAAVNPDFPTRFYWSSYSLEAATARNGIGFDFAESGASSKSWNLGSDALYSAASYKKGGLHFPADPDNSETVSYWGYLDGAFVNYPTLSSWDCSFPGGSAYDNARLNVQRNLKLLGGTKATMFQWGMYWDWNYADRILRAGLDSVNGRNYFATAYYNDLIQCEIDTGGTKGQLNDMVLWFQVSAEEVFWSPLMEDPEHNSIPAGNIELFGESLYLEPVNPEDQNDPKRFTGHLIKAFPPFKKQAATPLVHNYDWYSTFVGITRIILDIDGDANLDGNITDDDADDVPEDHKPFGVVVRHNNNDSDANGVPDDEDAIINGETDVNDLSQLVLRGITLPDCAEYSLRLRLANPDGGAVDQVVRIFDGNNPGTAVPILGPDKTQYDLPRTGPGVTLETLKSQEINLWAEGIAAGAGVQVVFELLGPNGAIASDVVQLRVFDLDLDIDANYNGTIEDADDPIEMSAGGRVRLNQDDDNNNGIADKDEAGTVTGENDLERIKLMLLPASLNSGTLVLDAVSGGGNIKVWTTATKGTEVVLPKTWTMGTDNVPNELYVEGIAASSSERDVQLRLQYTMGSKQCEDNIALTVINADLDVDADYNGTIEDADDPIEMSAGGRVWANQDDDNINGIADKDETGTVTGENDLELIKLTLDPTTLSSGTLKLEAISGGSKIKVWTSATKGTEVVLPKTWTLGTDTVLTELYVEGIEASAAERDVELQLRYAVGTKQYDDNIKLTVINPDLDIDANYDGTIEDADDPIEMSVGGVVMLNQDDDNNNGIADKDEAGSVTGENDLELIKLKLLPASLNSGTLVLDAVAGGGNIKVWTTATKGTEVVLPKTWTIGTDPVPATLYIEGIVASSSERDVQLRLQFTTGIKQFEDNIDLTVVGLCLKDVSFSGAKYWELKSDDTAVTYSAPQWMDKDGNSDAADVANGEHNYSVAYTRETKATVGATLKLDGPSSGVIKIRATGNDGIIIPATVGPISVAKEITLPPTISQTPWPNTVKFYARNDASAFKISWEFSYNGSIWHELAKSKHQVYLTLKDRKVTSDTTEQQETLFHIGCKNGSGLTSDAEVENAVWSEFADRIVSRVDPLTGQASRDASGMIYWRPGGNGCVAVSALLSDGDASCGTWAQFMEACLDIQGISGHTLITIDAPNLVATDYLRAIANYKTQTGFAGNVYYSSPQTGAQNRPATMIDGDRLLEFESNNGVNDGIFFVKQLTLGANKIVAIPANNGGFPSSSSTGQGNPNARAWFGNHAIVKYDNKYYDSSYGGTPFTGKIPWEDASLQYFGGWVVIGEWHSSPAPGSFVVLEEKLWNDRPDPKGTLETNFTPP